MHPIFLESLDETKSFLNLNNKPYSLVLETKRLRLRQWKDDDLFPFYKINSDPKVCKYLLKPLTRSESNTLAKKIKRQFDTQGFGFFAVEYKHNNAFIGFTGLNTPNFNTAFLPGIEIGWRLSSEYWNQGLATEAAIAVRDDAFKTLNCSEILSFTIPNNKASIRIMEKIGMSPHPIQYFQHPHIPIQHPLSTHCLYKIENPQNCLNHTFE